MMEPTRRSTAPPHPQDQSSSQPDELPSTRLFSRRALLLAAGGYVASGTLSPHGWRLMAATAAFPPPSVASSAAPDAPACVAGTRISYPPLLDRFISKLDPASDIFPTERYIAEIAPTLKSWSDLLCRTPHDTGVLRGSLSASMSGSSLLPSATHPLRSAGTLHIERLTFANSATSPTEFLTAFSTSLRSFTALDVFEMEIYAVRILSESPLRLETEMRFNLTGDSAGGVREQRVGAWTLSWARQQTAAPPADQAVAPPAVWMVERWVAQPEIRSRCTGRGFTEITAECIAPDSPGMAQLNPGIDAWRNALDGASGIDVYGNHGIAVGDIDGSGFDSFYVCQPSGLPNRLFRNRGDGTFEDITAQSGTGILDGTASALFVDFRNRGHQDLLVVRSGGPLLFVNNGHGRFTPEPEAFHFARAAQGTFTSAAIGDYNGDGLLDVYFCVYSYYEGLSQYSFPSPFYYAQNGPPNFLFRNRGDGTFEDVTQKSGMDVNNNRFSFAAQWCSSTNNGLQDLYVANDFGRKNLYRNNGDGTFTDIAATAGVEDYGPGMSVCWFDYDNDGLQDLYVANMWLAEGKRITAEEHFLNGVDPAVRAIYKKHNSGNSLYRNTGKGVFEDKTAEGGTFMGGWSWSSDSWDFDHDGYPDIYVANGFVSSQNRYDLQGIFWRQVVQCSAGLAEGSPDYELAWNAVNELVRSDYSWAGYQRNFLYVNNHDGTFSPAAGALGLDLLDDSRAFALSDFNHDGCLDFVLKNRTGPQLRICAMTWRGSGTPSRFA